MNKLISPSSIPRCPLKNTTTTTSTSLKYGCSKIEMYLTTAVTQQQYSVGKNFMLTSPKSSRMQWHQSVLGLIKNGHSK